MDESAATLKESVPPDAQLALGEEPIARGSGMKFSYQAGSRPLAGYAIQRGVGIGGFGEVYFALSDAGKEVALKRVQRNLEIELRGVSQCLNLKHQNLVDLYDIKYDDQGGAWVVMEYITGENLKDVIDRHPHGMPREEVLRWFHGLAAGVAYLHEQGIVHRDLKPGNIFIDQGIVKIGDYGLAKFISCSRRSGHTESVGTFHYMAPEIGKGSYGKQVDIYALGIILFEMLTGRVPFEGESSQEIIMRHLTEDPPLEEIPEPFRRVIAQALTKDPQWRYENAQEMLTALEVPPPAKRVMNEPITATIVENNVLYISDESPPRDMQFGPVKHHSQPKTTPVATKKTQPAPVRRSANSVAESDGLQRLSLWLDSSWVSTGLKVSLVMIAILVVCFGVEWLIPLGVLATLVFVLFAGVSFLAHHLQSPPINSTGGIQFRSWQEMVRDQLRGKPLNLRLGELFGSWLSAALVCALMGLVMIVVGDRLSASIDVLALYAWLTLSATLAAWAVLAVGKWCEGVESDAVRRRLVMLALGLVCGGVVFGLSQALLINLSVAKSANTAITTTMYDTQGTPQLPLFLVFFGTLFLAPRWWKQTDPMRRTRVNLLSLGACVLFCWLLEQVWPFPEPWGLMSAAMVSVAVQISAPWMSQQQRDSARREFRRA